MGIRTARDYFATEARSDPLRVVGTSADRREAPGNVSGKTAYVEDRAIPGLAHLVMARSPHHHAVIRRIDIAPARRVPGFIHALTASDIPKNWNTILSILGVEPDDEPCLAEDKVRYLGEPVVALVAETPQAARRAAAAVLVDYDPLPAVFDAEEALKPDAPLVGSIGRNYWQYEGHHCRRIRLGDVEAGLAAADLVVEGRYDAAPIEHAPLEPTGCIAVPEGDGRIAVYTNTQALFFSLAITSIITRVEPQRLRMIGGVVGGGFGGKNDVAVEPLAVVAAIATGRPVKYFYSRQEEMRVSSVRSGERFYFTDGVMRDGRIIARRITHYLNSGAYTRLTNYGTTKCAAHMPGPYTIPNVWCDHHVVFTNNQPGSAMRGFGVTFADFAIESQMNKVARSIGMDPWRLRMINAYRDGDMRAHRKQVEGAALVEVMQAAARLAGIELDEDLRSMSSQTRPAVSGP
jgi:CO/xanthine dehydrogenase Mo-binding subunit